MGNQPLIVARGQWKAHVNSDRHQADYTAPDSETEHCKMSVK